MKNIFKLTAIIFIAGLMVISCKKELDTTPQTSLTPGGATNGGDPNYMISTAMPNILMSQGGACIDPGITVFN